MGFSDGLAQGIGVAIGMIVGALLIIALVVLLFYWLLKSGQGAELGKTIVKKAVGLG